MTRSRGVPKPVANEPTTKIGPGQPDAWDRTAAWLAHRGALPAVGVLTIGMAVIYAGVFRGELTGDDLSFHFAESARLADCLRHGDFDLWNPSANGGFASAYYYQVLPQLASALPAAAFGHHLFWFQLSVFLPLVLAPLGGYHGMRLLGAAPWQAAIGAFTLAFTVGASRWGFSADGTFSVGLYTQTWALAAFPTALGYAVRWTTAGTQLAPAVAWGTFVGLCHPFGGVSLALALVVSVIAGVVGRRATWRSPVIGGLVVFLLGLIVFAIWFVIARDRVAYAVVPTAMLGAGIGGVAWGLVRGDRAWRTTAWLVFAEPVRLVVVGVALALATMPGWITLLVDRVGFGGFPHRVHDEVGPGFGQLWSWFSSGMILDHDGRRADILTWLLPVVLVFARGRLFRWLWVPALCFALLLGVGPHMPKTADDLIPAVRFLGAMQIALALGIGAGVYAIGKRLWDAPEGSRLAAAARIGFLATLAGVVGVFVFQLVRGRADAVVIRVIGRLSFGQIEDVRVMRYVALLPLVAIALLLPAAARWLRTQYGIRTAIAATAAALGVVVASQGAQVQGGRVRTLGDQQTKYRGEMMQIIDALAVAEPRGRKQVGPGCENHWWNLLSYAYARIPAVLQMGGGGLQASPNYDFIWSVRDNTKNAWLYDAPYLVFETDKGGTMPVGDIVIQTARYQARRLPSPGLVTAIQITGMLPAGPTGANSAVRKAAIAWMRTSEPLDNRHLAYDGSGPAGPPPAGTTVRAWRQDSPGDAADIVATVEVTAPTTFVIRESWHPRWHAFVDGREVPVRRVTPDFPAVDVTSPGAHVIQLRFERPWWAHASWLAWPGISVLAWLVTWLLARRRAHEATPA